MVDFEKPDPMKTRQNWMLRPLNQKALPEPTLAGDETVTAQRITALPGKRRSS